MNSESQVSIKQ